MATNLLEVSRAHEATVKAIYERRLAISKIGGGGPELEAWVAAAEELAAVAVDVYRYQRMVELATKPAHQAGLALKLQELVARHNSLHGELPHVDAALVAVCPGAAEIKLGV